MKDQKYYTPTIEEIHVGFACQVLMNNGRWEDMEVSTNHLRDIDFEVDQINEGKVRVRYIDREGIESLGWSFEKSTAEPLYSVIEPENFDKLIQVNTTAHRFKIINNDDEYITKYLSLIHHVRVDNGLPFHTVISSNVTMKSDDGKAEEGYPYNKFAGLLLNISELKRIMQMIGILRINPNHQNLIHAEHNTPSA